MQGIRIKKNNVYKIEVNDEGEYIEFDLEDIGLRTKLYKALENIRRIEKEYTEKFRKVKSNKELAFVENDFYQELRNAMDSFLGENACKKIFGDRNYANMFNDLLEELTKKRKELNNKSHFDMLQLSTKEINSKIMEKYKKNKKNVI